MGRNEVELYEEKLSDGRCKYRLPYVDPLSLKRKTISVIMDKQSSGNYKAAKRILDERLFGILEKTQTENLTLGSLFDIYLTEKSRILKESTLLRNEVTLRKIIGWIGPDTIMANLTAQHIRRILLDHSEKTVTYNEYLKRFKGMLSWAYDSDYLPDRSIFDKLHPLKDNRKERASRRFLEREELQSLIDASTNQLWNYTIRFLALSGMRIGELISLKDSEIDDEYIHVRSTYENAVRKESTPKTYASIRDIYIRAELRDLIREIRAWIRKENFRNGVRTKYFICQKDGDHISYDAFRKYLRETSEKSIGRPITPHILRHTATSLLIASGVPLDTVSRMLGHEDSEITKEIYLHVTKKLIEKDNAYLKDAKVL